MTDFYGPWTHTCRTRRESYTGSLSLLLEALGMSDTGTGS